MSDPRFTLPERRSPANRQFRNSGAWLAGLIIVAVLIIGFGIWAMNGSFNAANNPPAQTTGQGPHGPITPANPALHENR